MADIDLRYVPPRAAIWTAWVVAALLMLPVLDGWLYGVLIPASALVLSTVPGALPASARTANLRDLLVVAALYVAVVALLRVAFVWFTTDNVLGLFLSFAAAVILGVAGPVVYMVWMCNRRLADVGLSGANIRSTALLAVLFGGVQYALTLWGYDLPAPVDWVPLLVMAMVVGVFESIFFRGFIQNRLEAQFGPAIGIGTAAVLYGMYHVGYGMGGSELLFLAGLGVVYAVAFAIARNVLVLWPLLTPLGSFYANVDAGDIELPWASIAGFADVFALMVLACWLAARHQRKRVETMSVPLAPEPERRVG